MAEEMTELNLEERILGMMEKMGDIWRCIVCGKLAEDSKARGNLKRHVETHLEGISHPCDICGHSSTSSGGLYQHKAKKHSELRPDKVFRRKKLAMTAVIGYEPSLSAQQGESNMIDMDLVEEKVTALIERRGDMLTCTPCGKTMPLEKKWAIRRHAEVHLEGMAFPCDTCGKVSKSTHGLYQHKAKQHPWLKQIQQENAKFKCHICGKPSKTSKGLSNHKWKYHKSNNPPALTSYHIGSNGGGTTGGLEVKYEQNGDGLASSDSSLSGDELLRARMGV